MISHIASWKVRALHAFDFPVSETTIFHHVSYGTNGPDIIMISPRVLLGSTVQISPRSDGSDLFTTSHIASWNDRAPHAFDFLVSEMTIFQHVSSGSNDPRLSSMDDQDSFTVLESWMTLGLIHLAASPDLTVVGPS
jgi:hypothetical protein